MNSVALFRFYHLVIRSKGAFLGHRKSGFKIIVSLPWPPLCLRLNLQSVVYPEHVSFYPYSLQTPLALTAWKTLDRCTLANLKLTLRCMPKPMRCLSWPLYYQMLDIMRQGTVIPPSYQLHQRSVCSLARLQCPCCWPFIYPGWSSFFTHGHFGQQLVTLASFYHHLLFFSLAFPVNFLAALIHQLPHELITLMTVAKYQLFLLLWRPILSIY